MFTAITHSAVFVLDQDEALDFYVGKLGLEVAADVDMGFMRWLTVRVPGETDREVLLEIPGPPIHDEETAAQLRELVSKGATGLGFILTTDDCQRTYDELVAKGVEFTQEPTQHFYGIDCGLRDPFGNNMRITQPAPGPLGTPEPGEFAMPGSN
ncbi:MAG: Glyoxalase/bleomycin resistance protein/dioxygenase [Solirubrobacterales bacterium]|nr:Glyoxalase/bleomycin resistance protein/dioxygenase [Solirubrobacterales bacterium]